jgi:hypothetical protein
MPDDLMKVYEDQNAKLEKILDDYKDGYVYSGTDPILDA